MASMLHKCQECGDEHNVGKLVNCLEVTDEANSSKKTWWWCRDCMLTICSTCHLMSGHTEHRGGEWSLQEIYRSTMQALEGRCSTRSNIAKQLETQIREFTATLECHLINLLQKRLEEMNEPDRLVISRLNRVVNEALCELGDTRSSVLSRPMYHMISPTRPAHQIWTMCTKDPARLKSLVSNVCAIAKITFDDSDEKNTCDVKFSALPPSTWSAADCATYLLEQQESAEEKISERCARHFGVYRSMKNGFPLVKSSSVTSERSTLSLPTQVNRNANKCLVINSKQFSELSQDGLKKERSTSTGHLPSSECVKPALPLEPSVLNAKSSYNFHVREMRPSSFRESSITDGSDSACALKEETFNSTSPSATSSIRACRADTSFESRDLNLPICDQSPSSCGPSTSSTVIASGNDSGAVLHQEMFVHFGDQFLSRPIDVIALPSILGRKQLLAISDSCGGVYIVTCSGQVLQHLPTRDSSASSLAIDPTCWRLLVSVMHSKGRSIHAFDIANRFKRVEVIPCPREPRIELSRTRWITVSPRGELFAVTGDNHKSALWMYNRSRKGWKILKESKKTRYQYLRVAEDQAEYRAVVLLTCDAAQNHILLFVADYTGTLINEYDLTKTYSLSECIRNPASAIVDSFGNLLVLDYATGRLWALLSSTKGSRRLKEILIPLPLGAQEALGIAACGDWLYITCFARCEIVCVRYMMDGALIASDGPICESPSPNRRALSLSRPPRHENQV